MEYCKVFTEYIKFLQCISLRNRLEVCNSVILSSSSSAGSGNLTNTLVSNIVSPLKIYGMQWDFLSGNGCHIPLSLSFSWVFIWPAEFNRDSIWMLCIALAFMSWPQPSPYIRLFRLCTFHTWFLSESLPDFVISMTQFFVFVSRSAWTLSDWSRKSQSFQLVKWTLTVILPRSTCCWNKIRIWIRAGVRLELILGVTNALRLGSGVVLASEDMPSCTQSLHVVSGAYRIPKGQ